MPDWDEDSPQLRRNLGKAFDEIALAAQRRDSPAVDMAKRWHSILMKNLVVPDARFIGAFRGETGLENTQVRVGTLFGVNAAGVGKGLAALERTLQSLIREMDAILPVGEELDADRLAAVVDLCAWVHAEWLRIHPFANGNGRTARLWANFVAMRYGIPPFIRLRPRLNFGYAEAGAKAMQGDWKPTAEMFPRMLDACLEEGG